MTLPFDKYTSHEYLAQNPSWDIQDSPWKARHVGQMINGCGCVPDSICEIGCGAGAVLAELRKSYPEAQLYGYDIAPDASRFWKQFDGLYINFELGDFFQISDRTYDVLLLLDVIEHLPNPFDFLQRLLSYARFFVFHVPLDLSAISVLREKPLLNVRKKVGHIHFFTKNIAFALLEECGYRIVDWKYTEAYLEAPQRSLRTKLAVIPRKIFFSMNKDLGVRLLGGETLVILAKAHSKK
ncbi:MAG: class I SAM-dependent methyltransferase [Desulfobacterales bacterium]|nr:class I SAM-dependent methyltransferase [Desulfobacterales bacterium]